MAKSKIMTAKATVEKKSEAAEEPKGELVTSKSHELSSAMEAYAGEGLENVTQDDLLVPRIAILQSSSDQLKPKKALYIAGAKVGDICNIGTGELYEEPMLFLPVHYMKAWLEWNGDMGAGLAAVHLTADILDECEQDEDNHWFTKKDHHPVQESAQFFGLNLTGGNARCFLGFKSTELKKARKWLTIATSEKAKRADGSEYTPALFYRAYSLSTVEEGNSKGDWVGWKIERDKMLTEIEGSQEIIKQVLKFRDTLKRGKAKADLGSMGNESETESRSERAM